MNFVNPTSNTKYELSRNSLIARKCMGLNHLELVEKSGLTRPVISGIENGINNPTIDTLIKLSNSLNLRLDLLMVTKDYFESLRTILNPNFKKAKLELFDIHIPENIWKKLLLVSKNKNKSNYGKIIKLCNFIVDLNFEGMNNSDKQKLLYLSVLGLIFQQDGFISGFEFGCWLSQQI